MNRLVDAIWAIELAQGDGGTNLMPLVAPNLSNTGPTLFLR
jgi:hypothetical protein